MPKYTATANYNDPFYQGLRDRGDVVEVTDDKPDDDDLIAKGQARHVKDLLRRGLLIEGEHTVEDLDKRDAAEAEKAQKAEEAKAKAEEARLAKEAKASA